MKMKDLLGNGHDHSQTIALARLPSLIRSAAHDFQQLTGLAVVTTLGSASRGPLPRGGLSPPVHPLCAKRLRQSPRNSPCDAEWRIHLRAAEHGFDCRIHTCPLGLRCASVPIVLGDELLGLAKCVSGPEISLKRFRLFVGLLEAVIARPSQYLYIVLLRQRMGTLQSSVDRLRRAKRPEYHVANIFSEPMTDPPSNHHTCHARALTSQVLAYLYEHFANCELSLIQVAKAMGRNEKYIAHLFVQHVGERMRPFIIRLRVHRACDLLLQTNRSIEQIAHDSGFAHVVQFRQSFRRIVGLTASEYRQVFIRRAEPELAGRVPLRAVSSSRKLRGTVRRSHGSLRVVKSGAARRRVGVRRRHTVP